MEKGMLLTNQWIVLKSFHLSDNCYDHYPLTKGMGQGFASIVMKDWWSCLSSIQAFNATTAFIELIIWDISIELIITKILHSSYIMYFIAA